MRNVSDTIARLTQLRAQHNLAPKIGTPNGPPELVFSGSNPGILKARFHLPKSLPAQAPLVVVLHGCTQSATDYDHGSGWSILANEAKFALLFAEQQRSNNPNLCFNWFKPADARRDCGEAHSIRQMIETMVVTHNLDRRRIFITGLSAGGAMAAVMLATYPEVFAGGGIIAGLPFGTATNIKEAFDRMRGHGVLPERNLQRLLLQASGHKGPWPRITVWQGLADQTVAPSNAETIAAQWRAVHNLSQAPTQSTVEHGRTRRIWCDPAGQPQIEVNMVAGMGHGTPIGGDCLGTPGPFMLDVGISSTREIAVFWGIAGGAKGTCVQPGAAGATGLSLHSRHHAATPVHRPAALNAQKIEKIIEGALRTAGLMR